MSKCSTGEVSLCWLQPVELWEYIDVSEINQKDATYCSDVAILPDLFPRVPPKAKNIKLVDKKWIYSFSVIEGATALVQEAYVTLESQPTLASESNAESCLPEAPSLFESISETVSKCVSLNYAPFSDGNDPPHQSIEKSAPAPIKKQIFQFSEYSQEPETKQEGWAINAASEGWILLSAFRLSPERISAYLKSRDHLESRAQFFTQDAIPLSANGSTAIPCYLVDPLENAKFLRRSYDAENTKWMAFEKAQESLEFNRVFYAIVNKLHEIYPKSDGWIRYQQFKKELQIPTGKERLALDIALGRLQKLKLSAFFQLTICDLLASRSDYCEAVKEIAALTSVQEMNYLKKELAKPGSFYNIVMRESQLTGAHFQAARKGATAIIDGRLEEFHAQWTLGRILAAVDNGDLSLDLRKQKVSLVLDEIETSIKHLDWYKTLRSFSQENDVIQDALQVDAAAKPSSTPNISESKPAKARLLSIKKNPSGITIGFHFFDHINESQKFQGKKQIDPIPSEEAFDSFWKSRQAQTDAFEKLGRFGRRFFVILEMSNLYFATRDSWSNPNLNNGINLAGSLCDATGAIQYLLRKQIKEMDLLGSSEFNKTGWKLGSKLLTFISIVGAVTDGYGAVNGYIDADRNGQVGMKIGNAAVFLSASASAIGGIATYGAISYEIAAAAAVPVAGAEAASLTLAAYAGLIGWIAIGLFVIGNLAIIAFREEAFETWCIDSKWGIGGTFRESQKNSKSTIQQEFRRLLDLVLLPKVQCFLFRQKTGYISASVNGNFVEYSTDVVLNFDLRTYFIKDVSEIYFRLQIFPPSELVRSPISEIRQTLKVGLGKIIDKDGRPAIWQYSIPAKDLHFDPDKYAFDPNLAYRYSITRTLIDPCGIFNEEEFLKSADSNIVIEKFVTKP